MITGSLKFRKILGSQARQTYCSSMDQQHLLVELTGKFPEHAGKMKLLLGNDEKFSEILDDFLYCRSQLQSLLDRPDKKKPIIEHYQKTIQELEEEILEYLSNRDEK